MLRLHDRFRIGFLSRRVANDTKPGPPLPALRRPLRPEHRPRNASQAAGADGAWEINMVIDALSALQRRLVLVDGDGRLHPVQGEPLDVIADELFTVVVVCDLAEGSSWIGWLATVTR